MFSDEIDGMTNRCPRCNHVINNQNVAIQRSTQQDSSLTVCFLLFPIKGDRKVFAVVSLQCNTGRSRQWDAFIGGTKKAI